MKKSKRKMLGWIAGGFLSTNLLCLGFLTFIHDSSSTASRKINPFLSKEVDATSGVKYGFKHVDLVRTEVGNEKEFFLSEEGISYLAKRFAETGIIGPEVSTLKRIYLGNKKNGKPIIGDGSLGLFYPGTNEIVINTKILKEQFDKLNLKGDIPSNFTAEEIEQLKAEMVLDVLVHEYGHLLFQYYATSPTDKNHMESLNNERDKFKDNWSKKFYDKFKELLYDTGGASGKNDGVPSNFQDLLQSLNGKVTKEDLFNIANEDKDINDIKFKCNGGTCVISGGQINGVGGLGFEREQIKYYYALAELVTRNLLSATMTLPLKFQKILLKHGHGIIQNELYSSNVTLKEINKKLRVVIESYFGSNIFKGDTDKSDNGTATNKAQDYVNLVRNVMGFKSKGYGSPNNNAYDWPQLSFIGWNNPWTVNGKWDPKTDEWKSEASFKYPSSVGENEHLLAEFDKIKVGGYVDKNTSGNLTQIGWVDNGNFVRISGITKKDFLMGYKQKINSLVRTPTDAGYYYWYTNEYIDFSKYEGKKLVFADKDGLNLVTLESSRQNDYGIVTNFNSGNGYDLVFRSNELNGQPFAIVVANPNNKDKAGNFEVELIYSAKIGGS